MVEKDKIKDATVVSEEDKKLSGDKTKQRGTVKDIPLKDEKQSDEKETVKVDFMKTDFTKNFIGKKTVKSDEKDEEKVKEEKKEDTKDIRDRIIKEEQDYAKQFTKEDFADIAEIMIDLLDTGISTALRFWAKDTSDQAYEINITKKKRLVKQLTLILVKYQLKWSLEFLFIITLLVTYWTPYTKARQRRKELKGHKVEPKTSVKPDQPDVKTNDNNEDNAQTSDRPKKTAVSRPGANRHKGNPGKS